jgi:hypothetical protein
VAIRGMMRRYLYIVLLLVVVAIASFYACAQRAGNKSTPPQAASNNPPPGGQLDLPSVVCDQPYSVRFMVRDWKSAQPNQWTDLPQTWKLDVKKLPPGLNFDQGTLSGTVPCDKVNWKQKYSIGSIPIKVERPKPSSASPKVAQSATSHSS